MEGKWEVFVKELKMVSFLSAPMIAVSFLLYCPPFVSLMMVGHLDELSLSGVSVTTSYATVTGYSLICRIEDTCSLHFSPTCIKSLSILLHANHNSLNGGRLEGLILLSGHLPNPELETSVLLLCLTITDLYCYIPYGFAATASARVSNELGARNAQAAKITVKAIIVLVVAEMVIVAVILLPSCFGLYLQL